MAGEGSLDGYRILELSDGWSAAAVCGRMLAEMGGLVTGVEPTTGNRLRGRRAAPGDPDGPLFRNLATGKTSLVLDLRGPEGAALLDDLLRGADVLVADISVAGEYGLDLSEQRLNAINPALVTCWFSAAGRHGPMADLPGGDLVAQALGGILATTGQPGQPPFKAGPPYAAHAGALMGGSAILAALYEREETGRGASIDMSLTDVMTSYLYLFLPAYLLTGKVPTPQGNKHAVSAPWDTYPARDGWVIVCMADDRQWNNFLGLIGRKDLVGSPRYASNDQRTSPEIQPEVDGMVADFVADKTMEEAIATLSAHNVPAGAIQDIGQLLADPHFQSRDMVQEMADPDGGASRGPYRAVGSIFKMDATPGRLTRPAPAPGADSRAVLESFCGYDADRIEALIAAGTVVAGDGA